MPNLSRLNSKDNARLQAGFTLVEMMVVLVIIGLMSSIVILTLPQPKPASEKFAQSFTTGLNAARQDAILSGQGIALGLSSETFGLMRYVNNAWQVDRETPWPTSTTIRFQANGTRIDLSDALVPLIVFNPIGTQTPFQLELNSINQDIVIQADTTGPVRFEQGP